MLTEVSPSLYCRATIGWHVKVHSTALLIQDHLRCQAEAGWALCTSYHCVMVCTQVDRPWLSPWPRGAASRPCSRETDVDFEEANE